MGTGCFSIPELSAGGFIPRRSVSEMPGIAARG